MRRVRRRQNKKKEDLIYDAEDDDSVPGSCMQSFDFEPAFAVLRASNHIISQREQICGTEARETKSTSAQTAAASRLFSFTFAFSFHFRSTDSCFCATTSTALLTLSPLLPVVSL